MKEKVLEVLGALAEQFGTTVDFLWEVLVRQAYIEAGIVGLWFVGLLTTTVVLRLFLYPTLLEAMEDSRDPEGDKAAMTGVYVGFHLAAFLIWLVVGAHTLLTGLLNPEYLALETVFSLIK